MEASKANDMATETIDNVKKIKVVNLFADCELSPNKSPLSLMKTERSTKAPKENRQEKPNKPGHKELKTKRLVRDLSFTPNKYDQNPIDIRIPTV